jgi:hypothetical protein
MILALTAVAMLALALAACVESKPVWRTLPSESGLSYEVSVRTYEDGNYADQPFELKTESKMESKNYVSFLSAEQCKNVKVAQTKNIVFIFYDELVLNSFSSTRFDTSFPRPFLCDMQHPFCKTTLTTIIAAKGVVSNVCTFI